MSRIWDALRRSEYRTQATVSREPSAPIGVPIPTEIVAIRPQSRIFAHTEPRGAGADRLRFLRLRLNQVWNADKLKKLLITSPLPHDGKSTVALNLAVTLAEDGKRSVLLVEGDLHRATISRELGLEGRPGVAECLASGADPLALVRRLEPLGCYFLPAGQTESNPSELLQGDAPARILDPVSGHFEWIVIDSPPVAPLTDTLSWKDRSDATLLITRAGRTPIAAIEEALTLLGRKHVLAIVLNGAQGLDRLYAKYYKVYSAASS